MLKGLGFLGAMVVVGVLVVSYIFGHVVPPGQMGVRQITFGPYQGFSKDGLSPGYHWSIPVYSTIYLVPQVIQTIELGRTPNSEHNMGGSIEVQTTDGSSVDVDVSILSRFMGQRTTEHGGPSDLIQKFGTARKQWMDKIRTATINELRKALGRLSTSEFYNPSLRELAIKDAHESLNLRLAEFGIKVEAILLMRYTYTEERIDTAIFQKNLQDQEERLNAAASLFAQAKADLEKVSAEWDAKIQTLRVEGDNKVRVIRSEADLYEAEQRAQGDLVVAKAKAEIDKLKAGALANSVGAEVFIGKELAPLLTSLKGGVVSELDPYDLGKWLGKLGVKGGQ